MSEASRQLVFHGAIILTFGLALGAPYARAINREAAPHVINSWRVAHQSLPLGATLMFALAAVLSNMVVGEGVSWLVAGPLIVSSYAFALSLPLAAMIGRRGLVWDGVNLAGVVYLGNLIGAATSMVAAISLLYAAALAL